MIARTWTGWTRTEDAHAYAEYLQETGIRSYLETPGNRGVVSLRREIAGRSEFLLISFWESEEAIARFAGRNVEAAVFYPEDDRFLIDRERGVKHFEVFQSEVKQPFSGP